MEACDPETIWGSFRALGGSWAGVVRGRTRGLRTLDLKGLLSSSSMILSASCPPWGHSLRLDVPSRFPTPSTGTSMWAQNCSTCRLDRRTDPSNCVCGGEERQVAPRARVRIQAPNSQELA